jgi:hypothetical protein
MAVRVLQETEIRGRFSDHAWRKRELKSKTELWLRVAAAEPILV